MEDFTFHFFKKTNNMKFLLPLFSGNFQALLRNAPWKPSRTSGLFRTKKAERRICDCVGRERKKD